MILSACSLLFIALVNARCYDYTPAFPLPKYDLHHPLLQQTFAEISAAIEAEIALPDWDPASVSIEVTSSKESLWSKHHTARVRNSSRQDVEFVDGDTLYRIASITKTFTTLGILYQHAAGNLSLDDPIDKYLEELKEEQNGTLPWKDITLRSLASQLSGIPRDFAQSDILNILPDPWHYGLPPVSRDGLLKCDEYATNYNPPCEKEDLLGAVMGYEPMFAPNQKSTYSNIAFELLGLVIEKVTGIPYAPYITEAIFKPLNMTRSSLSKPPDSHGVIPIGEQYWDVDEGVQNPTGGIYSSTTDLSKYLRYILTHYNGITHATNWLHPASATTGLQSFYGMPWEIFRTTSVLPDTKRAVTYVTKSGGLPGYSSMILLVPEYDLGITVLVAGTGSTNFFKLLEIVAVKVVQMAEKLGIEQLQKRYQGVYTSPDPHLNSSITLVADNRGLVISSLISNGTDLFATDLPAWGGAPSDKPWYPQLIPTLLYRNPEDQEGEIWRFVLAEERPKDNTAVFEEFCVPSYDLPMYGGLPLNELVLWGDDGVDVDTVELTAFRVKLKRSAKGKEASGNMELK